MLWKSLIKKTFVDYFFLAMIPAAALKPTVGYSLPITPALRYFVPASPWHDSMKLISPKTLEKSVPAIALNKHVVSFVEAYVKREEEFLLKMKGKSRSYFRTIEKVFAQHDIPPQIKYLAIVESQLQSNARSGAGARGMWQLMPVTAKELGLQVSGKTDERLHIYRSTVAAARYLQNLYQEFGDWLLVLAAYNSGPGTVYKAIKKAGSRNFWALQRFLPAESRGHVKRFIGVHWFFEGEGSIATQTKAEAKAWQEKISAGEMSLTAAKPSLSGLVDLGTLLDITRFCWRTEQRPNNSTPANLLNIHL